MTAREWPDDTKTLKRVCDRQHRALLFQAERMNEWHQDQVALMAAAMAVTRILDGSLDEESDA